MSFGSLAIHSWYLASKLQLWREGIGTDTKEAAHSEVPFGSSFANKAREEQAAAATVRFRSSFANKACEEQAAAAVVHLGSSFVNKPRLEQAAAASVRFGSSFANKPCLEKAAAAAAHSEVRFGSSFTNKARVEQAAMHAEVRLGSKFANKARGEEAAAGWPAWLSDATGEVIDGLTPCCTDWLKRCSPYSFPVMRAPSRKLINLNLIYLIGQHTYESVER
jgi:hypothetical protein